MRYFLILFMLLPSFLSIGQKKYNYKQGSIFITKAGKCLKQDKLEKTEMFLQKARSSDYGFCGNAWAYAYTQIDAIQAQVYNKRQEYDKALTVLDSMGGCEYGGDCEKRDSLKIVTLIHKFGKEKVKTALLGVREIDDEHEPNLVIKLVDLNYTFNLYSSYYYYLLKASEKNFGVESQVSIVELMKSHKYFKILE